MATEFPSSVGEGWNTGISVMLAAVAVFIVGYPALLFLAGVELRVVTLVYGLVPAVGSAVFVAGWIVQREYSFRQLWIFTVAFIAIAAFSFVAYRLVVEPHLFGDVYEIHFAFTRFGPGVRIGILGVITALAYALSR